MKWDREERGGGERDSNYVTNIIENTLLQKAASLEDLRSVHNCHALLQKHPIKWTRKTKQWWWWRQFVKRGYIYISMLQQHAYCAESKTNKKSHKIYWGNYLQLTRLHRHFCKRVKACAFPRICQTAQSWADSSCNIPSKQEATGAVNRDDIRHQ